MKFYCFIDILTLVSGSLFYSNNILGSVSIFRGSKLADTYLRFYPRSLVGCARECLRRKRCLAINYHYGYKDCQLSYTDGTNGHLIENDATENVLRSDIKNWNKEIAGYCTNHNCGEDETCNMATRQCKVQDCGPRNIDVDKHTTIHFEGHHVIGNGVQYRCAPGYTMYNETGRVENNIYQIMCQEGGVWEKADFFCKNAASMLLDFCPHGYIYHKSGSELCFKEHKNPKTREKATKICADEEAHLLNIDSTLNIRNITEHLKENALPMIDGYRDNGSWFGWAGQQLSYNTPKSESELDTSEVCLAISGTDIVEAECSSTTGFICQFELCPESAGYKMLNMHDACYKVMSPRFFNDAECLEEVRVQQLKNIYDSDILSLNLDANDYWTELGAYALIFAANPLASKEAYLYNGTALEWWMAERKCSEKNLRVAVLNTEERRQNSLSFLGNRTQELLVGMFLHPSSYKYEPEKGNGVKPVYTVGWFEKSTDTHKCTMLFSEDGYCWFKLQTCDTVEYFICSDIAFGSDNPITSSKKTYDNASAYCHEKNTTLLQLLTKEDYEEVCSSLTQSTARQFYIGHFLAEIDYVYYWISGQFVPEGNITFRQSYSEEDKNNNRNVVYYLDTDQYGLTNMTTKHKFLCQTRGPALWYDSEDCDENSARVVVAYDSNIRSTVARENNLSYVCSVDTNRIIRSIVFKKKNSSRTSGTKRRVIHSSLNKK